MLAQVILVTRLLGLVNGEQPIQVQAGAAVRAVQILVDGKSAAGLRDFPANAVIDFGPELAPHEVTAVAYDANGAEVARDTQFVNLARPKAEAIITLDRATDGLHADVRWEHIGAGKPKLIELTLDGKSIRPGHKLPPLDASDIHVLQARVEFPDVIASKELVFGGMYSEQLPAELTAVLAHSANDCFQVRGDTVRAAAIEKPEAFIVFVHGSSTRLAHERLALLGATRNRGTMMHQRFRIDDAQMRIIWPTARQVRKTEINVVTDLFPSSYLVSGKSGTHNMLTWAGPGAGSQRFADAVAVAGVQSLAGAKRRAVVLVLAGERDHSRLSATVVRRYLARIGVPLLVWSLIEITPQMTDEWGEMIDITNAEKLRRATEALREELDGQRVAWLPIAPLDARHARPCPAGLVDIQH